MKAKCAHPSCKTVCNPDQFCYGCRESVCKKHALLDVPEEHAVDEHWLERQPDVDCD